MRYLIILLLIIISFGTFSQQKNIHIFVALCDNEYQGIVKVPEFLGDGKDPGNNLYWGAAYGIKNYFRNKTTDWVYLSSIKSDNTFILDRVLFKHKTEDVYLLADAYDGEQMKKCMEDFLNSSNGNFEIEINYNSKDLKFGGNSKLLAFIGHNGLMDTDVAIEFVNNSKNIDIMILACYSKEYFRPLIKEAKANPILWTTNLMAPEAYSLKYAIDGWLLSESGFEIEERAAQAYHKYQKCGMRGARNLFTSGF